MFITNKVAIITGGASGIGLCYAIELLKNGLRAVTLADSDSEKGDEAVVKISEEFGGDKVLFVKTDVTDKNQIENAFKKTVENFKNVDILVNNAGIMIDLVWEKEIAINLNGTIYGCFLGMDEYLPKYRSGDEAVIVNISSIAGLDAIPSLPVYAATKHAIIGLSKSLGVEEHYERSKVRILTICPGVTSTPLMTNLYSKIIQNDRYKEVLDIGLKTKLPKSQEPQDVSKGLIKAIEEGKNGSFWMIEAAEIYELEIPTRCDLKKTLKTTM